MSRPTAEQSRDAFGFALATDFPEADASMMLELDFLMIEGLGIGAASMKENAARAVAALATRRFFGGCVKGHSIVVLVGKGGNGDVALLSGRRLADWGAVITYGLACDVTDLPPAARHEIDVLDRLGRPVNGRLPDTPELIIDGLIGYSLRGTPQGRVAQLIGWANAQKAPKLAIDVPSGFDSHKGHATDHVLRADATLALGLPKFRAGSESLAHVVGDLYVGDIAIPPEAWARLSTPLDAPFFGAEQILRLPRGRAA